MRGTIVPGRNSSGAEAAPGCYNAEELLYDFLIIIIRNTSRGLLTVQRGGHHAQLQLAGEHGASIQGGSQLDTAQNIDSVTPFGNIVLFL